MGSVTGELISVFILSAVAIGLIGWLAVWARKRIFIRVVAVFLTVFAIMVHFNGSVYLWGKPKPIHLEWSEEILKQDAVVLGHIFKEGVAIYLWLRIPGVEYPVAYSLPWNLEKAKQLNEASREAENQGTELLVNMGKLRKNSVENDKSSKESELEEGGNPEVTGNSVNDSVSEEDSERTMFHLAPQKPLPLKD